MPTTSNFGWTTPADTDLVKDGAAAIRTLGNGIDTSLVDLKGGTTGQILSKASNTDLDYTWITNDVGDITAVTAGTGISGGGTSGAVTITNSMATAIDAKGDLVAGTGADAFSRLAVGANGTVLTADSAETTGLKWAAAASGDNFTLINSGGTSLSGSTTTVSGISGKNKIYIFVTGASASSASARISFRINGDTASNYNKFGKSLYFNSTYSAGMSEQRHATLGFIEFGQMASNAASNMTGYLSIEGCNSSGNKIFTSQVGIDTGGGSALVFLDGGGYWNNTATVTSVSVITDTGNFDAGTMYVYAS